MEMDFSLPMPPLVIGATGQEAIAQNIRIIVTTLAYSVALDRAFANTGNYIDSPSPHATALKIAELTEAIEAREPRAKVESIRFVQGPGDARENVMEGRVFPVIRYSIRQGAI